MNAIPWLTVDRKVQTMILQRLFVKDELIRRVRICNLVFESQYYYHAARCVSQWT